MKINIFKLKKNYYTDDNQRIKRNIISAIPILFIISMPLHFLYNLSGKLAFIGALTPVNESIFEHFKLGTVPLILWWVISYYILKKKQIIDYRKWFFCAGISVLIIPVAISSFYYTYTGALGITSLILDIFSLLFSLIVAQGLALHLYTRSIGTNEKFYIGILILIIIVISTIIFTFNPPHLPIFKDSTTNLYGLLNLSAN